MKCKQGNPHPPRDNRQTLKHPSDICKTKLLSKANAGEHKEHKHSETTHSSVDSPSPLAVFDKPTAEHKARNGQDQKHRNAKEVVKTPMNASLCGNKRRTKRIAVKGVSSEYSRTDKTDGKYPDQNRPPH